MRFVKRKVNEIQDLIIIEAAHHHDIQFQLVKILSEAPTEFLTKLDRD